MAKEKSTDIVGAIRGAKTATHEIIVPLLKRKNITIGRSSTNSIVIKSEYISKQHCRIYATESSENSGMWMACVEDLTEGMTWLNGVKIGKNNHKALYPGCILTVGHRSTSFYFVGVGHMRKGWMTTTSMKCSGNKELVVSKQMIGQGSQSKIYLVGTRFRCHQQLVCRRTNFTKMFEPVRTQHLTKLENEIAILRQLDHANVIRLVDYTINHDNTYSMIFPLVCGGTLEKYTGKRHGKPPLGSRQIAFIMHQLCSAIKYIHSKGIIHRDLKPSNILVYKTRSPYHQVVVNDFGLSINVSTETNWNHSLGTKRYFAPEIAHDDGSCAPFDAKVDCWSLGLVLHQLFTHKLPYETKHDLPTTDGSSDDTWDDHRHWILNETLDLTSDPIYSTIPTNAKELMQHLLVKDPAQRYSSEDAFHSPFVQIDFTKHGFLKRKLEIQDSYRKLVKRIKNDAVSFSDNHTTKPREPTKQRRPPSIAVGAAVEPLSAADMTALNSAIQRPMHFANGKPIYPQP